MARVVNLNEANLEFSRLIEEALTGDEVLIARAGVPVARIVPLQRSGQRELGQGRGEFI